jgi:tRNA(His) guanylyltransferase
VIVRLDGRAFHTFTASFPPTLRYAFCSSPCSEAAKSVAIEMQGFKLGYTQSDEVSFVMTDYDTLQEQCPWFDYDQQKVATIAASIMTAHFNQMPSTSRSTGSQRRTG